MGEFFSGIIKELFSVIGELVTFLFDNIIGNFLGQVFNGIAYVLFQGGMDWYNKLIDMAAGLLIQNPESWAGGEGWNVITGVNSAFIAIGATVVIAVWYINLIQMSCDLHLKINSEIMIKQGIKLGAALFLVNKSIDLVAAFFGTVDMLTAGLGTVSQLHMTMPEGVSTLLNADKADLVTSIIALLFSIVFLGGAVLAGAGCVYIAFIRFFKILLVIPYGAIASAQVAGGHNFSHGTVSYYKYVIASIFDGATMLLALKLSASIISTIMTDQAMETSTDLMGWVIKATLLMFVTFGAVKESSQITQRGLGL